MRKERKKIRERGRGVFFTNIISLRAAHLSTDLQYMQLQLNYINITFI